MASKSERVKVEVKESTTGEARTFNITLTAPANDFLLTDLLKQRGVIDALDAELTLAVKAATENYLKGAESLIAKLAAESKPSRKSGSNGRENGRPGRDERSSSRPLSEQSRDLAGESSQAG